MTVLAEPRQPGVRSGGAVGSLLDGLDPEQREAAEAVRGPVCILAGAGTGKTRTITHRIAHAVTTGVVPAGQVLAVTFTARAAGELRGRLAGLGAHGVQARTFHAAALRQLGYFWPRSIGGEMPRLVDSKIRLVAESAGRLRMGASRTELRDLTAELEWAKAALVDPAEYVAAAAAARRSPPREAEAVASLYAAYEEAKRRQGVLDFDDLLLLTAAVIEDNAGVADELRSRYRHFVVDEYQDVNPLQHRLLDAWLGDRSDLCVVGDANQTIYSFTGASPRYLLEFSRRFPDATVVRLVRDYRSTPQVVELANAVISRAQGPSAGARLQLIAQRPPGPKPAFTEHDSEPEEAAAVAAACAELIRRGTPASEIAVLYRVNAQSEAFEQAMASAGVPVVLRGGDRFFDRPEVREAVMLLRGAARGMSNDAEPLMATVTDVLASRGFSPTSPPPGAGAERERFENLMALVRLAEQRAEQEPAARLPAFVAELEERQSSQHAPTVEGVTLASLHASKGLEWDAVFLVGLVEGTVPLIHAETPEQVEEERRLLYVGVTRARQHLSLSWALARAAGGRRSRKPSRFLDGLLPAGASAPRPAAAPKRGLVARCRVCGRPAASAPERTLGRCETCPGNVDAALFDQLRAWRKQAAAEKSQPAFCVFTDLTLTAIAECRPTDVSQLRTIAGVGASKIEQYGDAVLALCAAHA